MYAFTNRLCEAKIEPYLAGQYNTALCIELAVGYAMNKRRVDVLIIATDPQNFPHTNDV
jgi:hypothetical protein